MNGYENVLCIYNGILFSIKKTEILSFAGKWMELENIIFNEVRQAQEDKSHMFSLIYGRYIQIQVQAFYIYSKFPMV
jgi:hypothetical protein